MKKILLSIMALFAVCTATFAQNVADVVGTYSGELYLGLGAPIDPDADPLMTTDVVLEAGETEGTVNFLLNDFEFSGLAVGDIALNNIGIVADGEKYRFAENAPVDMALADGLIQARVNINSETSYIEGDNLVADVDIVWVQDGGHETPIYVRINTVKTESGETPEPEPTSGIYQFADPGFENWTTVTTPYDVWSSFESAGGSLANMAGLSPAPKKVEGFESQNAVQIESKNLWIAKANGNLTTGTIMMGSADPANSANYNASDKKLLFAGRPDKVSCDAIFTSGGSENGRGRFILHGDVNYRDPDVDADGNYYEGLEENLIGEAAILIPETNGAWQHFEAEFTYRQDQPAQQWMLASFTTNPVPGGSAGDVLTVDNVVFTYYHALSALSYEGAELNFDEAVTEYDLTAVTYDPTALSYTKKGAGATVETAYDDETGVLTLTVKGNDYAVNPESVTTYTLRFKVVADGIDQISADSQVEGPVYNLQGVKVSDGTLKNLPQGLYIVGGKKVFVK